MPPYIRPAGYVPPPPPRTNNVPQGSNTFTPYFDNSGFQTGGVGPTTAMTVMPFAARVQKLLDEEFADGHRYYTKEAHVSELADEAIDILVAFWKDMPMGGEVEIIGLGGAITDVDEDATAFSNRDYLLWLNFAMSWDDPANDKDYLDRTRTVVGDLKPWTGRGIYVNMLNFDEMDRVVEAFGGPEKYARLGRVKAQYDPENLFRMNNNITPVP